MKNQKIYLITGIILFILVFFLLIPEGSGKKKRHIQKSIIEPKIVYAPIITDFNGTFYVEAPPPSDGDLKLEAEAEKLWPHIKKSQPTEADKDKVKKEWESFAEKYPANLYIPREFKPPITEEEDRVIRQQLDDLTSLESKYAAMKYVSKYQDSNSGSFGSNIPTMPLALTGEMTEKQARENGITPEQQSNYFSYKIRELESRVQLAEFLIESNEIDNEQKIITKKEMEIWKKELEELIKIKAQIPSS